MSIGFKEFVGPYRMFHLIRAGAIFEIWAVRPVAETTAFAMKWLPPGNRYDRANVANLKHEYDVGKTLEHPSVIKTYDFGNGKDGAYLIMELFKTPNLKQQIHDDLAMLHYRLDKLLIQCADSLEYLHNEGWVHRDIKPDNFLVDEHDNIRLIDFNLTRKVKKGLGKLLGNKMPVQGTYSYMAPEQIRGQAVDERADMYSFGCMVYELLSGKLPFTATSPAELLNKHLRTKPQQISVLNKNVHADFADLVMRMLSKEPKDRPDSFKEFIRTLKAGRVFQIKPRKPQPKVETKEED
jgi:eukaryotic-like serine/threonine-protein kinase